MPRTTSSNQTEIAALMSAIRTGSAKAVQECLSRGHVDLNTTDEFDYTPLILASLCGHYEIVEFLLESGARCERDTFQGERAVYSALTDRIRNLLIKHDYSVAIDRRQPYCALIASLFSGDLGQAIEGAFVPRPRGNFRLQIATQAGNTKVEYLLHNFVLVARSSYFRELIFRLSTESPSSSPAPIKSAIITLGDEYLDSHEQIIRHLYLADQDVNWREVLSSSLEMRGLAETWGLSGLETTSEGERQSTSKARKRHMWADTVDVAQSDFLELWNGFLKSPLRRLQSDSAPVLVEHLEWNVRCLQPDVLLQISVLESGEMVSYFYGTHRGILQSDFISAAVRFKENHQDMKQPVTIVQLDMDRELLEVILQWSYTDILDLRPELALDLLFKADMLLAERLKTKTCLILTSQDADELLSGDFGYTIFDVARAGWLTGTSQKLDPFCAKYIANHLEVCLVQGSQLRHEFEELVKESAALIRDRQETDTIELIDDIRHYLNERFRMRFRGLHTSMFSEDRGQSTEEPQRNETSEPPDSSISLDALKTNESKFDRLMSEIDLLLEQLHLDA